MSFFSHHQAIIKLRIPGVINYVSDHHEYSQCRTVTIIIFWQRFPSPVIQINRVVLRMSPISLDPEFHIYSKAEGCLNVVDTQCYSHKSIA
ncbi:hypothetical protein EC2726950_4986 [Escherichia coli 2726950]|nr:hypothetical protein EC2726950_2031 [Escherichia coli 2726950]ENA60233.1 hypothetical protein EC2726950_4986 [Escherichia coli 2726950]